MIVEIGIITAQEGKGAALEAGLTKAREVISRADGFRDGPLFPQWRGHFGHLMAGRPDVAHYNVFAGD